MAKFKNGDLRNGTPVLPMEERKTILLLSDDLRMSSGVATVSKEFVLGTLHQYNYVQLGAAVKHPEQGKELDLSEDVKKFTGLDEAYLRIVPWSGYGDANILRRLLMRYNPAAIIHFTDPRYWRWLYDMEAEIRENVPIIFYTIWDNVGSSPNYEADPAYNKNYYASCDGLLCISKQTYGMVNRVLETEFNGEFKIDNDNKNIVTNENIKSYR